jgi:Adaptor complexes medium subunit family
VWQSLQCRKGQGQVQCEFKYHDVTKLYGLRLACTRYQCQSMLADVSLSLRLAAALSLHHQTHAWWASGSTACSHTPSRFARSCSFGLPSVQAEDERHGKMPPMKVKFEIPYFTVSGVQVRYLKVIEKSGYQALPWVRYITTGGNYEIRMH